MINALNRWWRVFGTGFCYSVFGLGGLAMALTWFPAINLAVRDPERRRHMAQSLICYSFGWFMWLAQALRVIEYRVEGAEVLAEDERCLVVANHPSLLDVVLIGSAMRRCNCIVKRALFHNPFLKGVVTAAGYIPNSEGPELLDSCRQALGERGTLLIFPEGTRSVPGQPIRLQRGAANIAVRIGFDLRLVRVTCTPPTFIKGEKWYHVPVRRPLLLARVGERISVEPFLLGSPSLAVAARRLNVFLTEALDPRHFDRVPAAAGAQATLPAQATQLASQRMTG